MKPVILTDIDDVCLSWQSGLPYFAQKYNLPLDHILEMIQEQKFLSPGMLFGCDDELGSRLIEKYNRSDFIRYLAPYMDALQIVNKLKKDFNFVAVTALGDSIDARLNRQFNLNALFPGAFKELYMCDHSQSKRDLFERAKEKYGSRIKFYVDDLAKNVDDAYDVLGCRTYWMVRGPRDQKPSGPYYKVANWVDIIQNEYQIDTAELEEEISMNMSKKGFIVYKLRYDGEIVKHVYGHVNQFLRWCPKFYPEKENPIFKECVEKGEIYAQEYYVNGIFTTSYHRTLEELKQEVFINCGQKGIV